MHELYTCGNVPIEADLNQKPEFRKKGHESGPTTSKATLLMHHIA